MQDDNTDDIISYLISSTCLGDKTKTPVPENFDRIVVEHIILTKKFGKFLQTKTLLGRSIISI